MVFVSVVFVLDHDLFPVFGSVWAVQVVFRLTWIGSWVGHRGKDAGDVLPDHPLGALAVKNSKKDEGQVTTRVSQSFSETCDAEGLAGGSPHEKVDWSLIEFSPFMDLGHVAQVWYVGVPGFKHGRWEFRDL